MLRKFNPEGAPAPALYSHGVEATAPQRFVFVSGQVGVAPDGSVPDSAEEQTRLAIDNLKAVLAGAGMGIDDIAKTTIYLTDERHIEGFMAAGAAMLSNPPAAATLLFVKALASPALFVEIEAIAVK